MNRLQALHDAGVSIWLDTLSRELLETGDLARLVDLALDAETPLVTDRLLGFGIKAHDLDREAPRKPPGKPADRALLTVEVEQRDVAFGRGVELDDLGDLEARLELRPRIIQLPLATIESARGQRRARAASAANPPRGARTRASVNELRPRRRS